MVTGTPPAARGDVPQSHQVWSTEEGLPDASVHQVFQSADGYLWVATEGGVARFDGSGFRVLRHETEPTFISNDISAIAEDASGALWFGTADGLLQSRGTAFHRFAEQDGLPSPAILSLATLGDGSLLALTSRGLAHFDGTAFLPFSATAGTILSLQPARDGTAWLLTSEGVQRYHGGAFTRQVPPFAASAVAETILGLQFGPNGAVWTRSSHSVAVRAPGLERVLQTGRDLPSSHVTALYVDRQGTGWIGTNRGLFSLKPEPKAAVQPVDSLRLESILSVMEDREGNLWVGTETSGCMRCGHASFAANPQPPVRP